MEERWRRPLNVISVEPHPTAVIWLPDGRVQTELKITYDRESTERIRQGYACAICMEVFREAWPERCPCCGRPIRARQAEYFEREFAIEKATHRPSLDEEAEGIRERAEQLENGGPR